MAEEAAGCGDFKTAIALCKELFDKAPSVETSRVLKSVSHLLIGKNKTVFRGKDRFTGKLLLLSQQVVQSCDGEMISGVT